MVLGRAVCRLCRPLRRIGAPAVRRPRLLPYTAAESAGKFRLLRHRFIPPLNDDRVIAWHRLRGQCTLGVERIVSISACGSLREDYAPGEIVIPDQVFDNTHLRKRSFFGDGLVAHISVADPFCPSLSEQLLQATNQAGAVVHSGGTFITIEGPRFSTRAESNVYRSWGMSLIGMTTSPEVFLAREAEMCYAVMAHVTDYDVWHVSEQPVTVEMVIEILNRNTQLAQQAIRNLVRNLPEELACECGSALATALITQKDVIPDETRQRLGLLVDKYLS